MTARRLRVAIVNDLAVACEALRRAIVAESDMEIAWTARDGAEAVAMARRDRPDAVLMDLIMPVMDGVESTRRIMREAPCPILVVTATVSGNASLVYEALGAGALDAVDTPRFGASGALDGAAALVHRLRRIARISGVGASNAWTSSAGTSNVGTPIAGTPIIGTSTAGVSTIGVAAPGIPAPRASPTTAEPAPRAPSPSAPPAIVAIGASTGGPAAVAEVLSALAKPLRPCVLVVQHVSPQFTAGYADWLRVRTGHAVRLARAGDLPTAGEVLVAGEDRHLVLTPAGTLAYREEPADLAHRPSVDELFLSLARHARAGVAVLLTGMGRDGADGMLALRRAGWHTVAQDEATSVVWGMPGAAVKLAAATEVLPLASIGSAVGARIAGARR
ncbi:MAG: chemotaxis-specific protein-glutamate methyltransferase CheB [Planctomycetota bacterium]